MFVFFSGLSLVEAKWKNDDEIWTRYDKAVSQEIEQGYNRNEERIFLTKGIFEHKNYVIDYKFMKQINLDTTFQRKIKRDQVATTEEPVAQIEMYLLNLKQFVLQHMKEILKNSLICYNL